MIDCLLAIRPSQLMEKKVEFTLWSYYCEGAYLEQYL